MDAITTTPTLADLTPGTYTLDTTHSRLGFVARHAMITKVRGSFNDFEATAHVPAEGLAAASVEVRIATASIDTRNEQRDGHLRSNDFLDVQTHPEIVFSSRSVEAVGADTLRVAGDLAMKGVTHPVTIDFAYQGSATDPFGNERVGFEGELVINRRDWNVAWNAALEAGGVLVSEKVTLEFEISAVRSA